MKLLPGSFFFDCRLHLLLLLVGGQLAVAQDGCCAVKEVQGGGDSLAGTYRLATPGDGDSFPSVCIDSCAYKRDGNSNSMELFCFKIEGATHTTECTEEGTTVASGAGGACDYPKDNVSTAEYQTKIGMPSSTSSPFDVVITFDAETTIGSCHSNCSPIDCSGVTCSITYTGSIPMELFNVKKVGATQFDDWSNIISVTVNGEEQC
jgi:hypothetical protein